MSEPNPPNPQDPHNQEPDPEDKAKMRKTQMIWVGIMIAFMVAYLLLSGLGGATRQMVEYSELKQLIRDDKVEEVTIRTEWIDAKLKQEDEQGRTHLSTQFLPDETFIPLLDKHGVTYSSDRSADKMRSWLWTILIWVAIFYLFWRFVIQRMGKMGPPGMMTFGKSKAKLVSRENLKVTFEDVAGVEEAKDELTEIVGFLKDPERYTRLGGRIPKGTLLVGPPGTGKTLLARAVAGEADVPFYSLTGSDFVEMFVGVGAARVRDMFEQAVKSSPCIVFIDELDALGKARGLGMPGGNDEREQTLNQLLAEMDGFDAKTAVIVMAATNRPETLDPALLRPGRFDRQVLVDRPDLKGREQILEVHCKTIKLSKTVELETIARRTPGFSGADLANVINEAALIAVRKDHNAVEMDDFEDAIDKVVAGLEKRNRVINKKEKEIVAVHEMGHAMVAHFTEGADPVHKISIIPRGLAALGYTMQLPTEDRFLMSEKELLGRIDVLLGGRAAEDLCFGEISTGASNDLVRATDIARKMITDYGMSKTFGNMSLADKQQPMFLGEGMGLSQREYSEDTARKIDEETREIIERRYDRVRALLTEKKDDLRRISDILLDKETIEAEEFQALVEGKSPEAAESAAAAQATTD